MTGTAHRSPDPSGHPAPTPPVDPVAARLDRRTARLHALAAVIGWFDVLLADLADLAADAGVHGDRRAIVFTAGIDEHAEHDHTIGEHPWTETLRTAQLIGHGDEVTLVPGASSAADAALWARAVELWLDTLDCLHALNGDRAGSGLLIDLDERIIASWYPYYCPDVGGLPDDVTAVRTRDEVLAHDHDPFARLLNDTDDTDDGLESLIDLMDIHDIEPPSTPAHEPGDCD